MSTRIFLSFSLFLTHCLSVSLIVSLSLSLPRSLAPSLTHSHTLSLHTHSLSLSLSPLSLSLSLYIYIHLPLSVCLEINLFHSQVMRFDPVSHSQWIGLMAEPPQHKFLDRSIRWLQLIFSTFTGFLFIFSLTAGNFQYYVR